MLVDATNHVLNGHLYTCARKKRPSARWRAERLGEERRLDHVCISDSAARYNVPGQCRGSIRRRDLRHRATTGDQRRAGIYDPPRRATLRSRNDRIITRIRFFPRIDRAPELFSKNPEIRKSACAPLVETERHYFIV